MWWDPDEGKAEYAEEKVCKQLRGCHSSRGGEGVVYVRFQVWIPGQEYQVDALAADP